MSHTVLAKPAVRWALAAGAVAAGALWFGDKAPYPYAQHKLLDLQLPRCEGQALEHLQRAIDHANDWIHQQDRARRRLFNRLDEAIRHGHDRNVSTLIPQARKLLLSDAAATPQEAATLQAADAFLEEALRRAGQERRAAKESRAAEARRQEARQAAAEEERRARQA
ncbi:hypothetical protein ACIA74_44705, partial [Streptomyces sp. NPDC051658]